jgi:hypothetical protein
MEEILMFIGLVPILYLAGRLYSDIRGKERSGELDLDNVKENVRRSNGFWEWIVPIAVSFAFIYNIVATAAWFVGELIQIALHAAKWIFNNVIITGPWFIARMAWHYLVIWPWKLLRLAFGEILPSITRQQFMTAFVGISLSLLLFFIGSIDSEGPEWLKYTMSVLSIFPLGWAVGKIGIQANGGNYSKAERNTYGKHLGFLILLFAALTIAEAFLINIGTRTSMSSTLSQLFMFGTFWGSALLLFNAVLLLFAISALPFVSANFNGSNKELLFALWAHIRSKGLRYALAIPMMAIPLFLLSIVPTLLSEGINHITNSIGNAAYAERIESMEIDEPREINIYDLSMSEDSIKIFFDELKDYYSATVNKRAIEIDRDAISSILEANSDETAAIPYYGLFGLMDTLGRAQTGILSASKTEIVTNDLVEASDNFLSSTKSRAEAAASSVEVANSALASANAHMTKVCNPSDGEISQQIEDLANPIEEDSPNEVAQSMDPDDCDFAKEAVTSAEKDVASAAEIKQRTDFIVTQVEKLNNHVNSLSNSSTWSSKIAWVLTSLFLALLFALQYGFSFVLFARVNARIYGDDDDDSVLIVDSVRAMSSENKNQPLLGIGLTVLVYLMYTGSSLLSIELPTLPNPIRSTIDIGVDVYNDVLNSDVRAAFNDESGLDGFNEEEAEAEEYTDEMETVEEATVEEVVAEEAPSYGLIDEDGDGQADYFLCISGLKIQTSWMNDGECDCGQEYCEDEL